MVVSAKQYLANNDVDGAIIQLRNALQENPNLDEARFLLGSALFDKGEFLAAEKELRKARELGYSDDAIVPLLVRLLTARGDYRQAIDEFAKVELRGPKTKAELQSALGQAYLETNNIEEARNRFADALSDEPDHPQALLGQARATAIQGDLPKALTLVGIAIEKAPTLPEGWQLKGDILSAQGQTELATGAYRKALEVRPDYVPAHSVLIASFVQQGKFDDGREQLEAMQKAAPKTPQTLYWQALLEFHQKDFVAARDAIQKYLVRVPGNVSGLVLAARIHNELDSYAEAESELKAVLRTFPKDISARMTLIDTYLRMGRVTNALDVLKPLLEDSAPGSDVLALAGELYARNGESVKAARYFEEAAALDPGNAAKRTAVAIAHLARGESDRELGEVGAAAAADTGIRADLAVIATLARQHKFDAALKAIDALEKKQPNSAFTHTLRGEILINKGDIPGARASFERALSIDATNFAATAHLAQLDFSEDKPDAAKRHFDALLAKDPKNAKALLAIAGLRAQTGGTTAEVASLIGEAITAAPTDPEPRLALIAHYLTNGEPDNAVAAGQEAVASMPDRTDILDALGRAQKAAGDTKTAIATYQRLAQLVPESPMPFLRIADLQVLAKDNQGARGSLRKALAVAPDLLEARRNLVILELADGSEQAAVALAREAQKQQPGESAGYVLEGDIYAEKKAWNDAIAAYRNGLKLVGTSDLAIKLIVTLRRAGNNAEADQLTASWRKQHPDDRTFSGYLAESAIAHKDYPNAARQYKAILEKQPNDAVALNNLAWISNRLKDPKALEYAERASALAPNNAAILDTLGGLLLDKGEIKRAVALEQKAVALAHDNPAIRLNYARALIKDDQKELARKELFILQQLGDTYPDQATVTELMRGL
jgi:putative PEP-CTERM system TPR-repeat lipoprotein